MLRKVVVPLLFLLVISTGHRTVARVAGDYELLINGNDSLRIGVQEIDPQNFGADLDAQKWLLCYPCEKLFDKLREQVHDVVKITESELGEKIKWVCEHLHFAMLKEVCHKIGNSALDSLYNLIVEQEHAIISKDCCEKLDLC